MAVKVSLAEKYALRQSQGLASNRDSSVLGPIFSSTPQSVPHIKPRAKSSRVSLAQKYENRFSGKNTHERVPGAFGSPVKKVLVSPSRAADVSASQRHKTTKPPSDIIPERLFVQDKPQEYRVGKKHTTGARMGQLARRFTGFLAGLGTRKLARNARAKYTESERKASTLGYSHSVQLPQDNKFSSLPSQLARSSLSVPAVDDVDEVDLTIRENKHKEEKLRLERQLELKSRQMAEFKRDYERQLKLQRTQLGATVNYLQEEVKALKASARQQRNLARIEADRSEKDRVQTSKIEVDRHDTNRTEVERKEADRNEVERNEADRDETDKNEAERRFASYDSDKLHLEQNLNSVEASKLQAELEERSKALAEKEALLAAREYELEQKQQDWTATKRRLQEGFVAHREYTGVESSFSLEPEQPGSRQNSTSSQKSTPSQKSASGQKSTPIFSSQEYTQEKSASGQESSPTQRPASSPKPASSQASSDEAKIENLSSEERPCTPRPKPAESREILVFNETLRKMASMLAESKVLSGREKKEMMRKLQFYENELPDHVILKKSPKIAKLVGVRKFLGDYEACCTADAQKASDVYSKAKLEGIIIALENTRGYYESKARSRMKSNMKIEMDLKRLGPPEKLTTQVSIVNYVQLLSAKAMLMLQQRETKLAHFEINRIIRRADSLLAQSQSGESGSENSEGLA